MALPLLWLFSCHNYPVFLAISYGCIEKRVSTETELLSGAEGRGEIPTWFPHDEDGIQV
jgi:hypothetical protein